MQNYRELKQLVGAVDLDIHMTSLVFSLAPRLKLLREQTPHLFETFLQDSPALAFTYANHIDKGPTEVTRKIALLSPKYAFAYALYVDQCSREDTRKAVLSGPKYAYFYAKFVDKCPREDTRKAAMGSASEIFCYTLDVDKCLRSDAETAIRTNALWANILDERLASGELQYRKTHMV